MKSEDILFEMYEKAVDALNKGDMEEFYVLRTHMKSLIEEEEKKPLDLHTDAYNSRAGIVFLDMFNFEKALGYLEKVKNPTDNVLKRINKTKEDIKTYEEMSDLLSIYLNIARNGTKEQLIAFANKMVGVSSKVLPVSYGKTLILIQLLKAEGIINFRLGMYAESVISLEEARKNMPADIEIMYYLIRALRNQGHHQRADYLIEYAKRLSINEEQRKILVNL